MQINPYLSFKGDCEAAFSFYGRCFGGTIGAIIRYAGSPMSAQMPPDWQDKVMHGSVTVGALELMGGDVAPAQYEASKGFALTIATKSTSEAERIFRELAEGGRVTVPLDRTFWAARFGMVVDRFGIPWMVNCEGSQE